MNYFKAGYEAGLFAAAAFCRRRAMAIDHGGNEYVRDRALMNIADAVRRLPTPEGVQRQPLTCEAMDYLADSMFGIQLRLGRGIDSNDLAEFGRAIERAHGIGAAKEPA